MNNLILKILITFNGCASLLIKRQNNWLIKLLSENLLPQMCAALPTNQCTQLKRGLLGVPGSGLMAAINGWMKHSNVVAKPKDACIVAELQFSSSTKITTKPAIVISHVKNMKNLCHCNKSNVDSLFYLGTKLKYQAFIQALFYSKVDL